MVWFNSFHPNLNLVKGEDGAIHSAEQDAVGEGHQRVADHHVGNDHRPRNLSSQVLPVLQGEDGVLKLGLTWIGKVVTF